MPGRGNHRSPASGARVEGARGRCACVVPALALVVAAGSVFSSGSCSRDMGLEGMAFACSASASCAAGFECIDGVCEEVWGGAGASASLRLSLVGPGSDIEVNPFLDCRTLRLCYVLEGERSQRGCTERDFTLADAGDPVDFGVPAGLWFRVDGACLPAGSDVAAATGLSCPMSLEQGSVREVPLLMMRPLTAAATVLLASGEQTRLATARAECSAAALDDGRILAAGGVAEGGDALDSAEIYDPRTGAVAAAQGALVTRRSAAPAVRLPDGRVALLGGVSSDGKALASVELFDPASGTFAQGKPLSIPRAGHTATGLGSSGGVLVAGGTGDASASYEIWTPEAGSAVVRDLADARYDHAAVLLPGAQEDEGAPAVLLLGGQDGDAVLASAEKLFQSGSKWLSTPLQPLCSFPGGAPGGLALSGLAAATVEEEAGAVVAGGKGVGRGQWSDAVCVRKEVVWLPVSDDASLSRSRALLSASAVERPSGDAVVFLGGIGQGGPEGSGDVVRVTHSSGQSTWVLESAPEGLEVPRWGHAAVATCDGRVFVAGGWTGPGMQEGKPTDVTELFNP